MKYDRLIFVCTENTSRSPMAEAIYRSMTTEERIPAISRGLVVLFPEPLNPKADMVLANHNLQIKEGLSRQLSAEDITDDSLVLTMTLKQKNDVMADYDHNGQVYTLKEFCGEEGDVTDPYGGTLVDYEACYNELARLIRKTVYRLEE